MEHVYAVDLGREYSTIMSMVNGVIGPSIFVYGNLEKCLRVCKGIDERIRLNGDTVKFVVDVTGIGKPLGDLLDDLHPLEDNVVKITFTANAKKMMDDMIETYSLLMYGTGDVLY